jgi:hypothetical protein
MRNLTQIGLQLNRDSSLTITHLLQKNLVTTCDAEKILWAILEVDRAWHDRPDLSDSTM